MAVKPSPICRKSPIVSEKPTMLPKNTSVNTMPET